ncbi:N-acetylmuramoyl-L-alanine amidase [Spirulina subsalsa]|uniref:N-acetylmuramoyl-L-alanine amidase n=1 Tax=Spirulina subsalsa TaxID=54311 RepID=UPI00030EAD1E|nr:N-acetylmuramoyl-L-alanine amidase [Spirulina subsalsa]
MKYGIDMGHNAPPDVGASSRFGLEDDLTKAVGTQVIQKLRDLGHEVIDCTPSQANSVTNSLWQRVNAANTHRVDVFVSIHFNAFNGSAHGTEIYAVSDAGRRIAQPVLESIVALGFFNRQVKNGSHLYVLRNTNMPAILVECCFMDSERDMNRYNTTAMANAIVIGLAGRLPDSSRNEPSPGDRTKALQEALNRLQIRDSNGRSLVEDGITGPATRSATQRFHEIVGINAAGDPVSFTWNALEEIFTQPVLRPNEAEGIAVRYVQFRIGGELTAVYDQPTVELVRSYQRRQGLAADGIVGPQTWSQLLGNPIPRLALEIIRDTVLKQQPIDSTLISDPNLKYNINRGEVLPLHSWNEEGNHVKVALRDHTFNGFNTWYAFVDHIEILENGKPLQQEPAVEQPQVQRNDAFNLPGYTSTFYLNEPILPNGHFFWREALHNGQRIPQSKAHVENILALASRLEEVRQRLGGFPMTVTSWYRPEPWNRQAGGAPNSRHLSGQAVDFLRPGLTGRQMASRLSNWPGGMGIYTQYPNLLHLDIRPYRARWGGA